MGQSTFSGPVRSLNGFLGTGPNMVQAITGTVTDSKTNINKYQGKVLTISDAATVFNLPDINSTTTQDDPTTVNNVGMIYEFVVTSSLTGGNTFVLNAGASAGHALADVFRGMAIYNNTATDPGAVTAFTAGGTDTLTLTATTKGGLEGAHIKCRAVAGLIWQIEAQLIGNGTFANPWS